MRRSLEWNPFVALLRVELDWRAFTLLWFFALPVCIFFIGWFKWLYAILGLLSLLSMLLIYRPKYHKYDQPKELFLMLISLFLVLLSGNGEAGLQTYDHFKHNLIFADLVKYDWPVFYRSEIEHLNYYLGYYLVPAWIGKILGIHSVPLVSLVYLSSALYLCLSFLTEKYHWTIFHLLIFFFFSAAALLVVFFRAVFNPEASISNVFDQVFLIWNGPWGRYPQIPIFESLKWVPQHFITSIAVFVLYKSSDKPSLVLMAHFLALAFFWSTYVVVSSCLFILLDNRRIFQSKRSELKSILPAVVIAIFVGLYYMYHIPGARNTGNFNLYYPQSVLYLLSSLLAFSLPLGIIGVIFFRRPGEWLKVWKIYMIGAVLLAVTSDFDLFARGTIIFQIAFIVRVLNGLKMPKKILWNFIVRSAMIMILFVMPGIISSTGPSFYYFLESRNWPTPKFTISQAYFEYGSVKDIYCAIDAYTPSPEGDKCKEDEPTQKYSGGACFLLK